MDKRHFIFNHFKKSTKIITCAITKGGEETPITPFLITRMFLYQSSISLPNINGNSQLRRYLLWAYFICFSPSLRAHYRFARVLSWALCVDSWFPCHLMSTSFFSNSNPLSNLPEISPPRQQSEGWPSFVQVLFISQDHLIENQPTDSALYHILKNETRPES